MSKRLELSDYTVQIEFPVHWGDMDSARHVNNLIYLRWAESSRIHYFEEMGIDFTFTDGVGPILGWQDCKYIFPMTFPDTAVVGVRITSMEDDHFMMESGIFSKRHQRIAAISKQSIIPYDYANLQRAPLPQAWKDAVAMIEEG